jgi:hypothetical protein
LDGRGGGRDDEAMDAPTLRATQAPIKQRYRDDPDTALTPLHARATFEAPGITATVGTPAP